MTPDAVITFLSNMDLFWLIMALAGGAFGAMIGGNWAFGFTGVTILLGLGVIAATGSTMVLDYVSFGPVFGPHITFAGAAAAAAYAGSKGLLPGGANGKDINTPLAGLNRPDVLLVGAGFGAFGYVLQSLIALIPWFGSHTDSVALTVVTSGIVARIIFGKTKVVHKYTEATDEAAWLRWQEKPGQLLVISGFASLLAAGASLMLSAYIKPMADETGEYAQILNNSHVLPFAISAICIFFVAAGLKFPVTHHMTITSALAAVTFFKITENGILSAVIGVIFGIIAAFLCELVARIFYNHGDTHIDPPAGVIWFMNTLIVLVALPFQG